MLEQPLAVAKQHGRQINVDLVQQPRLQALLDDVRAANDDMPVPGNALSLFDGARNAVRNEGEWRTFLDPFLWRRMGDDERAPTIRRITTPRAGDIEIVPSCDQCADRSPERSPMRSALAREILNTISVPGTGNEVSPLVNHLKSRRMSSFGPAMKPSSDIVNSVMTFPIRVLLSV
jgi:hypothetical protein